MSARSRKLRMEQMEAREMMAGDIAASVVNGNLILNEATGQTGKDNSVLISQIAPGRIRVTGNSTTTDGTTSLVNGLAYQDFNVTGNLSVNFGGGSDLVVFDGGAPPSFQDVTLNLGAPPLLVAAKTFAIGGDTIKSAPDKDNVMMWGATVRGSLTVNTGADNDWIYIANAQIGDGIGTDNVTINSGAGADSVQLKNLPGTINGTIDVQTYSSLSETDADVAWFEHTYAAGNINVRTGGGNDLIHFDNLTSYKDINLDFGTGDDTGEIKQVLAVDNFFANLGDGNDSLAINDLYGGTGKTSILGGTGFDSLTRTGTYFPTHDVDQSGWEMINGRLVLSGFVDAPMATARL
jgi:hypothetical protein